MPDSLMACSISPGWSWCRMACHSFMEISQVSCESHHSGCLTWPSLRAVARKEQVVPFIEELLATKRSEPKDREGFEALRRIRDIPVETYRWLLRPMSGDEQQNVVMPPMPFQAIHAEMRILISSPA